MDQIGLLLRLYSAPLRTFSRILDEGKLVPALIVAGIVAALLQIPQAALMQRMTAKYERDAAATLASGQAPSVQDAEPDVDEGESAPVANPFALHLELAISRFTAELPWIFPPWSALLAVMLCFVPATILVLTLSEGWRSFCALLYRDYLALLLCILLAWSAAYLPLAVVHWAKAIPLFWASGPQFVFVHPALRWGAHAYFLILSLLAIRTVTGVGYKIAAGAVAGGWTGAITGIMAGGVFGFGGYWLLSPCLAFALWATVQRETRMIGWGLRSRQSAKRYLESSTVNPRDADARCQLGLIHLERHQNGPAIEHFRAAITIEPDEPDAHYHLGRVLRMQGQFAEALDHLRIAARIDDKYALNEVWRELGAAAYQAGGLEESLAALEKFLERRPYDPEGRCWYGRLLAKLGRKAEAQQAFHDAIEAVQTMPPARRRQVKEWQGHATRELRNLAAGPRT